MDTNDVRMVQSAKGFDMLCVDGYLYHYENRGPNCYRWVCNKRKDKQLLCRSRITTKLIDNDESKHFIEKISGEHTHDRCSRHEISKVVERKRIADLAGKPCTLENKTLKRKLKSTEGYDDDDDDDDDDDGANDDDNNDEGSLASEKEEFQSLEDEGKKRRVQVAARKRKTKQTGDETGHLFNFNKQRLYLLRTARNNQMICVDGYLYRIEGKSRVSSTFRWECTKVRDTPCKVRILTEKLPNGSHKLKGNERVKHDHQPYKPWSLTMLLHKNNISVVSTYDQHESDQASDELGEMRYADSKKFKKHMKKDTLEINPILDDDEVPKREKLKKSADQRSEEDKYDKTLSHVYKYVSDPLMTLSGNVECNPDEITFTFLPSAKGHKVLCMENFIYHFDSSSPQSGRTYWTCKLRRNKICRCNARVTTKMSSEGPIIVKATGRHLHPECLNYIKQRLSANNNEHMINDDIKDDDDDEKPSPKKAVKRQTVRSKKVVAKQNVLKSLVVEDDSSSDSFSSMMDESYLDDAKLPTRLEEMREPVYEIVEDPKSANLQLSDPMKTDAFEDINMLIEEDSVESKIWDTDNKCDTNMLCVEESPTNNKAIFRHGRKRKCEDEEESDLEPDMDTSKVSKLRSAKGRELLCVDGYLFHRKSTQNLRTYWTCIKSKDTQLKCKSRVSTVMSKYGIQIVKVTNHHSHPIYESDIKRRIYNEFIKKEGSSIKPRDIIHKDLHELSFEYAELVANSKCVKMRQGALKEPTMKLYAVSDGPPSLAVRMALKALKIPFELINVDYVASEHMSEEYAKMNPQKEIPVLDDNGFYLPESIAIMQYLCDKYAPTSVLYPTDPKQRALVNHRLCFNMGFYYSSIAAYSMAPIFFDYERTALGLKKVNNALAIFETYLERGNTKYAAADHLTIADFALVSATLCLEAINFDLSPFPLVKKWYETFKEENPDIWEVANGGMQEIAEFEKNPPDLSHMDHPFHPIRKSKA